MAAARGGRGAPPPPIDVEKLLSITARLANIVAMSRAHAVSFNPLTKENPPEGVLGTRRSERGKPPKMTFELSQPVQ